MDKEQQRSKFSLWLHFTFFIQNIKFPYNISTNEDIKDFREKLRAHNIDMQFSEHWEEPHSVRRFLWGFFPHLHLTKKFDNAEIEKLLVIPNSSITDKPKLKISTVWGGASMAVLEVNGELNSEPNKWKFDWINEFQDPNNKKAHEINKWFIKNIIQYLVSLRKICEEKPGIICDKEAIEKEEFRIKWAEWANEEEKEDYIVVYDLEKYFYKGGDEICKLIKEAVVRFESKGKAQNDSLKFFYQEPYLAFWFPFEIRDIDINVKKIEEIERGMAMGFFGCCPVHYLSRKVFLGKEEKEIERIREQQGLGEILIPKNILMYFDPSRAIIFYQPNLADKEKGAREEEIHRAIFVSRTRMHFCILWEARLQALSQQVNDILRILPLPEIMERPSELDKCLRRINDISLKVSATSSELFNSFIWRYATFLPSRMGNLSTFYNAFDKLFNTSTKTNDIRNYLFELRQQIEFASNFVREKIAEHFPKIWEEGPKLEK